MLCKPARAARRLALRARPPDGPRERAKLHSAMLCRCRMQRNGLHNAQLLLCCFFARSLNGREARGSGGGCCCRAERRCVGVPAAMPLGRPALAGAYLFSPWLNGCLCRATSALGLNPSRPEPEMCCPSAARLCARPGVRAGEPAFTGPGMLLLHGWCRLAAGYGAGYMPRVAHAA